VQLCLKLVSYKTSLKREDLLATLSIYWRIDRCASRGIHPDVIMGLSKSTRIMILLGIDASFFLLELIVGMSLICVPAVAELIVTGLLTLITIQAPPSILSRWLQILFTWWVLPEIIYTVSYAYSWPSQLNDVLSLCVGLWAVKVASGKTSSAMYTYGVSLRYLWTMRKTLNLHNFLVATRRNTWCSSERGLPSRTVLINLPWSYTTICRTARSFKPTLSVDSGLPWSSIQHPRPFPISRTWTQSRWRARSQPRRTGQACNCWRGT